MSSEIRGPGALRVTVTNAWEDVAPALRVVHDGFVEAGFMEPTVTGLRVIPEYMNPGAIFFVCRHGTEVVATMAWIPDGPFGLPSDRAFPDVLDGLRARGVRLTENSSFTVAHAWRRMTRHAIMRLFAAAMRPWPGDPDLIVTAVMPGNEGFYQHMFGFQPIGHADDLFGAPATLVGGDLCEARTALDRRLAGANRPDLRALREDDSWLSVRLGDADEVPHALLDAMLADRPGALAQPAGVEAI